MLNLFKQNVTESFQKELLKNYINIEKVQKLIDNGANIHKLNDKGQTLLFPLVKKKRIEAIRILIKNGIDVNHEDNFGKTVLSEAVERGDGVMIRFLIDNGASLNYVNSSGRTLLQDVALEENHRVFDILMAHKPDLNIVDNYGRTVLFDAVEGGNLKIIREVLNNIENPNIVDENGQTVLFNAVLKESPEVAKFLVMNGIDIHITDDNRENVLFNAVVMGASNIEIIELLLEKGIKLNIKNINNETVLDEILKILSILKDPKQDAEGRYKLVNETRDYLKLTTILIEHGLAVNRVDNSGKTVLYKEVERENYDTINFLLDSGADINAEDKEGRTVLFEAIFGGIKNISMIEYLVIKGADIDHRDIQEKTIIDELCEIILVQGNYKRASSRRYLNIDDEQDYFVLLKRMINFRPKINRPRSNGRTVIFDIIIYNNLDLVKLLFNAGADPNIVDEEGNTPLTVLVDNGLKAKKIRDKEQFLERLVYLLKFRIDVNVTDKEGRTVYHKAVIADDIEVVEKLLSKKANLNIKDNQGRNALHHTQWKGNYKIARLLIAAGADINAVDYAGFSVLNYAAIFGHTKLVIILIASGVLMYNYTKKSRSVAKFFKEREKNLAKLLQGNITDPKMISAIKQVIRNLRLEIHDALK
ncbi:hypothetical protein CPU12_12835 [Malaciobacter molluscorum LMG 25693]|uniref:Ankyrin domain-containing protein n=1 Tax=Malaciobacter molluscorum LMG 25693 TaxID=870501 RepID=A0A2G1DET3_9BACT|nr:ankyrin repeat domain-containing protein [Malaciobacter molluscorum]AXX93535.1 ankyrin domain-containing protein [Malaciobacter molluscorum LMG 25693]PHO16995.1 hypothetical protein CPU12_12835 [Malaciobacter molluscorum LMG 25693]